MELVFRFLIGGLVVSFFSVASDILYPKVFAGLLASAPSVALASLGLTVFLDGPSDAGLQARSMIAGAAAFLAYAALCRFALARSGRSAHLVTTSFLLVWLGAALTLRALFLR